MTDEGTEQARARKVILCVSDGVGDRLEPQVAQWIRDHIAWVAVVGFECDVVEARIDELVVRADRSRFIMTTAHPNETLEEVTDFMLALVGDYEGDVAIVVL